jgi:hypothetical protein
MEIITGIIKKNIGRNNRKIMDIKIEVKTQIITIVQ